MAYFGRLGVTIKTIKATKRLGLEQIFQNFWACMEVWASKAKLSFAPHKTVVVLFKMRLPGRVPILNSSGIYIPLKDKTKHLVVTLAKPLSFLDQVISAAKKAKVIMVKVCRVAKLKYGVIPSEYHFLYNTVFIPIVVYGSEPWRHRARKHLIKKALRSSPDVTPQRYMKLPLIISLYYH